MKHTTIAALTFFSSGCALLGLGGPPSPVGQYTIETEANGQPLSVTVTIREREDGSYAGTMITGIMPTLDITEVSWREEDRTWIVIAPTPEAPVEVYMVLDGDSVSGAWTFGIDMGDFTGTRTSRDPD